MAKPPINTSLKNYLPSTGDLLFYRDWPTVTLVEEIRVNTAKSADGLRAPYGPIQVKAIEVLRQNPDQPYTDPDWGHINRLTIPLGVFMDGLANIPEDDEQSGLFVCSKAWQTLLPGSTLVSKDGDHILIHKVGFWGYDYSCRSNEQPAWWLKLGAISLVLAMLLGFVIELMHFVDLESTSPWPAFGIFAHACLTLMVAIWVASLFVTTDFMRFDELDELLDSGELVVEPSLASFPPPAV